MDLRLLKRLTDEFNFYRSPECVARVLSNKAKELVIEFRGTKADFACCFDENFVDYKYYLKDFGESNWELASVQQNGRARYVVTYKKRRSEQMAKCGTRKRSKKSKKKK